MINKSVENSEEIKRIQTLLSFNILDTPQEKDFDELVQLISIICDSPVAIISAIDDSRQWYKAKVGIEQNEVPLGESFCQYTVVQDELIEIPDARMDSRVKDSPHVLAENGIRFYAGMPLKAKNGYNIGTICVVDNKPKNLSPQQRTALKLLTTQAMRLIETRKKNKNLKTELENILNKKIEDTQRQLLEKVTEYNYLLKALKKSNAVVEFSPEGLILNVNKRFLNLLGYQKEELIGKQHEILLEQGDPHNSTEFWNGLREGNSEAGRVKRLHKDKREIWLQCTYNPIVNPNDEVIKIIKIAQDITLEIEAEKALKKAKELAENLNMQKDNFIANVSHEIRTPIHAVLGFTELLLEQETNPTKTSYLQSVKTAGDTLLFIINDILDLSKMEAGEIQIEKTAFELEHTVKNVISILHLKAHQKKIDLEYKIDKNIPNRLLGDKNRLAQILINLIGNAIKFTAEGGVKLHLSLKSTSKNFAEIEFRIIDTGIGIEEDKLDLIFQRFTQAEVSTSRNYGGTGLGLNISRQLIEKQNGEICVKSVPGEGSEFIFSLNYSIDKNPAFEQPKFTFSEFPKRQENIRILLCDDNEFNQRLLKAILFENGYEVDIAGDGLKGLEFFANNEYDLVLMDIQMPGKDGYETSEIIREKFASQVPIIALTANSFVSERKKCLQKGMNDYLAKPFKKEDLLNKIDIWVNKSITAKQNIISLDTLEELTSGDQGFKQQMIELFRKQSLEIMESMQDALPRDDFKSLVDNAHKLKTSYGIIGADLSILERIENTNLKNPNINLVSKHLQELKIQLNEILDFLEKIKPLHL